MKSNRPSILGYRQCAWYTKASELARSYGINPTDRVDTIDSFQQAKNVIIESDDNDTNDI